MSGLIQLLFQGFGASDLITGVLCGTLPSAIGAVVVPAISFYSDRHRGRWGRRIPYLLVTAPVAALAMVGMAGSAPLGRSLNEALGGNAPSANVSILIFFGIFWTIFQFAAFTANAVFGGLVNDVVPTLLLGRFFGLFRALSLIAGMIFSYWLFGKAEANYDWVFIGIGALYFGGFSMMCLKVKEGTYPPRPVNSTSNNTGRGAVRLYLEECFSNSYYRWIYVAIAASSVMSFPVDLFGAFFAQSLQVDMGAYGKYLALTYVISLCLSYFIGALADRYHPLRMGMAAMALYAANALWSAFFVTGPRTFAIAFVAHGVISGSFFTATASIGQRLFPVSRFAQFASAAALFVSVAIMIIAPAVGRFLDFSGHVYRYSFLVGFGLAVFALLASIEVNRRFVRLGGANAYVAPE